MIVDKEDLDKMENLLHGTGINKTKVWQSILLQILLKARKPLTDVGPISDPMAKLLGQAIGAKLEELSIKNKHLYFPILINI